MVSKPLPLRFEGRTRNRGVGGRRVRSAARGAGSRTARSLRGHGCDLAGKPGKAHSPGAVCGPGAIRFDASPVHVDHRHRAGRVRDVLCSNRNSAIGTLRDKPDAARRAAAYPEGNLWKPTLVAPGVCQLPS
ncbi:endonuclease domain-containing protein [Streptomyces humi]